MKKPEKELQTSEHFLVDSEMENGRQRVYNFAMDTPDPKYLLEKLDVVFDSLKSAAKLNVVNGCVLENVEDGSCRGYCAHENNTLMERSKLLATTEGLTKAKNLQSNTKVIEPCIRERANAKWKFCQLTNVTIFQALLKELHTGCTDTELPDPPLKNHSVKSLTLEENTRQPYNDYLRLFRALALHLHGTEWLEEETTKLSNLVFKETGGTDPANIRGVYVEDIAAVEGIFQADIIRYDTDIVDRSMNGELARRRVGKHSISVRLFGYSSHICFVFNINALFEAYRCPSCDQIMKTVQHLERHLTTCKETVRHVFPMKLYHLRETLFVKLDLFNMPYYHSQKLFKNMTKIDFLSVCVKAYKLCAIDTITWIGKRVPISVSISFILIGQPIFFAIPIPSFVWVIFWCSCWVGITEQSKNEINVFGYSDDFEE